MIVLKWIVEKMESCVYYVEFRLVSSLFCGKYGNLDELPRVPLDLCVCNVYLAYFPYFGKNKRCI
jgi:hypothetical protein